MAAPHPHLTYMRGWIAILLVALGFGLAVQDQGADQPDTGIFAKSNLVAWCIVPFDAKKRGPEERAAMLANLGVMRLAYDYRAEHIPSFDAEIAALKKRGIELAAWWLPTTLNGEARHILEVLKRNKVQPQLWVMGGGEPARSAAEQEARVVSEAARLAPIADAAREIGCQVALYNHGGWFGHPTNQLAIIQRLARDNVGIVYNLHHAHDQVLEFPALLERMKPHLLALNLNGMVASGDKIGKKIVPVGRGELDLEIFRAILASGWRGPVGILNHTDEDAEGRLLDNLDGVEWLLARLQGRENRPPPKARTWNP